MRRRPRLHLLAILASLATTLWWAMPAAGSAPPTWGSPVAIAPEIPTSWFPEIQADPSGAVRLVWAGSPTQSSDGSTQDGQLGAVWISQLGADGWGKPGDIFLVGGGQAPRAVVASDGQWVHLLTRKDFAGATRLYYLRAPVTADLTNAHSWNQPIALSDQNVYYSNIIVLPDGTLVTIFNQMAPRNTSTGKNSLNTLAARNDQAGYGGATAEGDQMTLFTRRSTDHGATWSPAVRLSDTYLPVARSSLTMSPDGKVVIASWDEGYDNQTGSGTPVGVGTAISTDGGATWRDRQSLRSPLGSIEESVVGFGASGPVLVYRSTIIDKLYYRTSPDNGKTWSEEQPVPGAVARPYPGKHNFDKLSLATDGDGRLLLAYVGTDPTAPRGLAVMVATFADGKWSTPVRVAAPDGYPEYPRLAIALGNQVHLVYFVRDNEFETGHYTLWSVTGTSDARAIAPVQFAPPATPVPLATSVPQVQVIAAPTVPPRPTIEFRNTDVERPASTLNAPLVDAVWQTLVALAVIIALGRVVRLLKELRN